MNGPRQAGRATTPPTSAASCRPTPPASPATSTSTPTLTTAQADYATATYTANGYLSTVSDANGNLTTDLYDGYDRLSRVEFPSPTTPGVSNPSDYEGYGYDNNGNVLAVRRRSGDTIGFTYDALNRAIAKSFSADATQNVGYAYDLLNRPLLAQYTTSGASVAETWDALSRLKNETAAGRTLVYAYDLSGERIGITWPDGGANALAATYVYDGLGRVSQILANGAAIANYAYDDLGRRNALTPTNGTSTTYGYDAASRLFSLTQSFTSSANNVAFGFTYNPAGQVLTRSLSNDEYANVPPTNLSLAYTVKGLDQYPSINGVANVYDARGNQVQQGVQKTWSYDLENHLTATSLPTAVALGYDPSGRLQTSTAGGATSTFLYASDALVGEYDGSGAIIGRYIPGPGADEALLWYQGAGTATPSWLHADNQGSIIAWSNAAGASGATYPYDPYGQPGTRGGWGGPRYRYAGAIAIPEGHFYHAGARDYAPDFGRFLETDPAGFASDLNIYAYAGNDPINRWDPSGLAGENAGDPNCPMCVVAGTTSETPTGTWVADGIGGWQLEGDLIVKGAATNLFDGIFRSVALQSLGRSIGAGGFAAGPSFAGLNFGSGPRNKQRCSAVSRGSTAQVGAASQGTLGVGSYQVSAGVAVDTHGNVALYVTGGYGAGLGAGGDVGLTVQGSNAPTVQDLSGPFGNGSAGGGLGGGGTIDAFGGAARNGQPVVGGGFTAGGAAGETSFAGPTGTLVSPSLNLLGKPTC